MPGYSCRTNRRAAQPRARTERLMPKWTRRTWMAAAASGLAAPLITTVETGAEPALAKPAPAGLPLAQFAPKSMLHVEETPIERARFPVIDIHTHLTFANG